ncbi:MAG: membrane protein [Peptococcaceae bacterium BRH_c8a]|nr:MAG: membrane protein [Peptococcaceae bacterium BRH_c8a]
MLVYVALINIITFCIFGLDKRRARLRKRRVPEKQMFFMALVGGTAGALLGVHLFRHKTLHRRFTIGLPLILLAQVGIYVYLQS